MAALTDRERELLVMAWQCFKTQPEVDYKKLQELGNYKTAASANACYLATKKKLLSAGKVTDKERELLVKAWQCFKAEPQVDYKKLQGIGKYKTTASANACYLAVKKKLFSVDTTANGSDEPKAAGAKRKKGDGDGDALPAAKPKKRRTKKTTATESPEVKAEETAGVSAEVDCETKDAAKHEGDGTEDEHVDGKLFATAQDFIIKQEEAKED